MKTKNTLSGWLMAGALSALAIACGGPTNTTGGTTGAGSGSSGGSAAENGNGNRGAATAGTTASTGSIALPTIRPDGSVVIGPGFLPTPIIMAGTAGGPTDASTMGGMTTSGYGCIGMMPTAPQHVLEVTAPISHLRIVVDTFMPAPGPSGGSNDTTLYVRLPGGTVLCDDDGGGELQPMVEGPVMPGRVEVFVGGYSSSGVGARYKIAFTESSDYTHYSIRGTTPPVGYY